jgi:type IV secretory pathway VirB10-like protein
MLAALAGEPVVKFTSKPPSDTDQNQDIYPDERYSGLSPEEIREGANRILTGDSYESSNPAFYSDYTPAGNADSNSVAMTHQNRNMDFIKANTNNPTEVKDEYLSSTRRNPISKYELKAGSIISGVLMGGINSDLPGSVIGQVSENIYDSPTGAYLLIPQGSRMLGSYDSHIVFGQKRVLVVWQRIIYPDGTSLNLEGVIGSDQAGYSGFKQKIDNHYFRLMGAALLASVFVAVGKEATENDKNADGSETTYSEAVMETMADLGARLAERNLNVAPTLRISPGYRFSIITTRDVAFAEPYYAP